MKKYSYLLLALFLLKPFLALAFSGGTGTSSDPYLVTTPDELNSIRTITTSKYYKLMNDLDLTVAYPNWVPLGANSNYFIGYFDGNGFRIKFKITSASQDYVGLFGQAHYTIKNLGVDADITTTMARVGGIAGGGDGTYTNCYCIGKISGYYSVGGLVGDNNGTITDCYCTAAVTGTYKWVGGISGVTASNITRCYSTGNITGVSKVGGLIGQNYINATISSCYSTGDVTGTTEVGGVVGVQFAGTIISCYSTGNVTGSSYVGSFVGRNYNYSTEIGIVTSGYFDKLTSGQVNGIGGGTGDVTGIITSEMKKQNSFSPTYWDFTNVWEIAEGFTYPALRIFSNNAPFAFRDSAYGPSSYAISNVLLNDYDFETQQTKLVFKVLKIYGTGTLSANVYSFPVGSTAGYTDSLLYRVGEVVTTGDTLWGNNTKAILMIPTFTASPANVSIRAADHSSATISVNSNVKWTVTTSASWLTLSGSSGNCKGSITLTATENTLASARSATVTFSSLLGTSTIQIEQEAKQKLTISLDAQNKTYDGNTNADVTASISDGLRTVDNITVTASNSSFDTKNAGNGKTVTADIEISGTDVGNYTFSNTATTTANITPATLLIDITALDKVYDGTANANVTASISDGLITGDSVTATVPSAYFDNKNVGNGKTVTANIAISGSDAGNYTFSDTAATTANITPANLLIDITSIDKVYDGTATANVTASITSGLKTDDDVIVTASSANFDNKNVGNGKTVTADIAISGTDAGNYTFNDTADTTANITPATLVIIITAQNKTFDGNTDAIVTSSISSGLISGDDVTVEVSNAKFDNSTVGNNKTVTADIAITGINAGNYICTTTATTSANILKAPLSLISSNTTSTFVKVFPTVNRGDFNLELTNPDNGQVFVTIFDLNGRQMAQFQYNKSNSTQLFSININTLTSGTYLIEVMINSYKEIKRIIVE